MITAPWRRRPKDGRRPLLVSTLPVKQEVEGKVQEVERNVQGRHFPKQAWLVDSQKFLIFSILRC